MQVGQIVSVKSPRLGIPPGLKRIEEILASDPDHETEYLVSDPFHPDDQSVKVRRSEIRATDD